jgi:hypothetical protein
LFLSVHNGHIADRKIVRKHNPAAIDYDLRYFLSVVVDAGKHGAGIARVSVERLAPQRIS